MEPRPAPPTLDSVAAEARARAELAKLGVDWSGSSIDERVYGALLDLPPSLGRPCVRGDVIAHLSEPPHRVDDALQRLLAAGRVVTPARGMWVALT